MDASQFIANEQPNKFDVRISVRGEINVEVEAASLEEAREKANAMAGDEEFGHEIDEVTDVRVDSVRKAPTMYLVTRSGRQMQVSRLLPGDLPRQPNENGF